MICEYGCGQEAKFLMGSGKWCCSVHFNKCPAIRKRNSEANKNRTRQVSNFKSHLGKYLGNNRWNKGLTKETNESLARISRKLKEKYKNGEIIPALKGKHISEETKEKIRLSKCGGYKKGCGKGKKGWYKGYWCDSSWELAFVIYNLEHGIKFERNKQGFEYVFENKTYKYYPDFILGNGT